VRNIGQRPKSQASVWATRGNWRPDRNCTSSKALSTLSQKSATVAENGEKTATVAEFGDSRTFLRGFKKTTEWRTSANARRDRVSSSWV